MQKIRNFLKKYNWIWIVFIVLVAYFGDLYLQKSQRKNISPTPTPNMQAASYKSVVPGISTEADLNKVLGTPVKTTINGSQKIDEYKSTSELRLHGAIIENGKVVFIKEIVSAHDTLTTKNITDVYGNAANVLYNSKFPNASFNLYVYPPNGIAYLGHVDGTLLEIWYFAPTTIGDFTSRWAQDYSPTPSTEHVQ